MEVFGIRGYYEGYLSSEDIRCTTAPNRTHSMFRKLERNSGCLNCLEPHPGLVVLYPPLEVQLPLA